MGQQYCIQIYLEVNPNQMWGPTIAKIPVGNTIPALPTQGVNCIQILLNYNMKLLQNFYI